MRLLQALLDKVPGVPMHTSTPTAGKPRVTDDLIAYLKAHPDYMSWSGRELAALEINGKKASYRSWNGAKKELNK